VILTVTPNPCVDKTVYVEALEVGTFMQSRRCTFVAGGKGNNVARAVRALGRPAKALVVVGGHTGEHVVGMIERDDGVPCVPVWVASPTRTITTVLEEPTHRQTVLFEPGPRVTPAEAAHITNRFSEVVGEAQVVAFGGTVPDRTIEGLYEELIPMARARGVITILDSHGPEFVRGIEAAPYMVKPNVAEAEEAVGFALATDRAKWAAIGHFHDKGVELVVLSLGQAGALVSRGAERFHVAPPSIEEVNAVGSGDALVAGFAIGLLEDMSLEETARLAVAAGTANATSWAIGHFTQADMDGLIGQVEIRAV